MKWYILTEPIESVFNDTDKYTNDRFRTITTMLRRDVRARRDPGEGMFSLEAWDKLEQLTAKARAIWGGTVMEWSAIESAIKEVRARGDDSGTTQQQ